MERRYLALVTGDVADDRGEVEAPIGRSARTPTKMAVTASGKPARTGYTVLERRSGEQPTTLLELALQSGRTHQIRVHMAAIGHPVVGDARYGVAGQAPRDRAASSCTPSGWPSTTRRPGARAEFTSPLPEDLEAYLG